jgi:hypothetical protein
MSLPAGEYPTTNTQGGGNLTSNSYSSYWLNSTSCSSKLVPLITSRLGRTENTVLHCCSSIDSVGTCLFAKPLLSNGSFIFAYLALVASSGSTCYSIMSSPEYWSGLFNFWEKIRQCTFLSVPTSAWFQNVFCSRLYLDYSWFLNFKASFYQIDVDGQNTHQYSSEDFFSILISHQTLRKHIMRHAAHTERRDWVSITPASYSGSTEFMSRPRHEPSWPIPLEIFLSPSRYVLEQYIKLGHTCFLPHYF